MMAPISALTILKDRLRNTDFLIIDSESVEAALGDSSREDLCELIGVNVLGFSIRARGPSVHRSGIYRCEPSRLAITRRSVKRLARRLENCSGYMAQDSLEV